MPGLTIGDTVSDLEPESTCGKIHILDYVGNGYVIIFSHPVSALSCASADFTPVCTTEMAAMADYAKEFKKRGA